MKDNIELKIIATIKTDFPAKFGIPRQSGLVPLLKGRIIFEPKYRDASALRGIEGFSHLWLLWKFSESVTKEWSPTVRPPRLGGNKRMGVFATRSPFRPNPIGLSSVKLEKIIETDEGIVLEVSGVDLMDGTPIYDIKPYIAYTDSHPEATGGFSKDVYSKCLKVKNLDEYSKDLSDDIKLSLKQILENDPRPAYQTDEERIYSFEYAKLNVKFKVKENQLTIIEINTL